MFMKIIAIVASYIIGSIPTAFIFGKIFKGIDIRQHGSGNVGATNAFRVLGKNMGIIVFLIDILKGFVPVFFIAEIIAPLSNMYRLVIFAAAFSGHIWTCFLNFKGGKGMAVSLGALIALALRIDTLRLALLLAVVVWIAVFAIFKYVSLASISSSAIFPVILFIFKAPLEISIFGLLLCVFIIFKHKSNISRLLQGKELRVKSALK